MASADPLLATAARIRIVDSFQYVASGDHEPGWPRSIRIIIRRRPASRLGTIVHDQYNLIVALRTPGLVRVDAHSLRLRPGEALLVPPGRVHGFADAVPEDVFWVFCLFHLPAGDGFGEIEAMPVRMPPRMRRDLATLLEEHFIEPRRGKRRGSFSERCVVLRLRLLLEQYREAMSGAIVRIERRGEGGTPDESHEFVKRIVAHIRDHISHPLPLDALGREFGMSAGHLRNTFARLAGISLGRYIRSARMRQACILLDTTDLALTAIARRCGYNSIFSFSRAFATDKGVPPTVYRRSFKPVR